jgi:hypothetical protein
MGAERSCNISLSGEDIPRPMTAGSPQNKYMHWSWWTGFTEKTPKPSEQFA